MVCSQQMIKENLLIYHMSMNIVYICVLVGTESCMSLINYLARYQNKMNCLNKPTNGKQ